MLKRPNPGGHFPPAQPTDGFAIVCPDAPFRRQGRRLCNILMLGQLKLRDRRRQTVGEFGHVFDG